MFVIIGGIAFITLVMSFKVGALLRVISGVCFMAMAMVMFGEYDVVYAEDFSGDAMTQCPTSNPCHTIKYLIDNNQDWVAWIFMILGIFSFLMFFLELTGMWEVSV